MDVPEEGVLDVDLLGDEGSEDEGEAPPTADFYPGPASTPTSCASSPRGEEPASPHGGSQPAFFHHQPYHRPFFTAGRRGPGRPRKDGPKLQREGKIVRRYRGGAGSVRGAKRHRSSRDDADEPMEEDEFTMPAPEEPPYMPEKWPGKLCALCNLSEKSQLGQGELRLFPCAEGDSSTPPTPTATPASGGNTPTGAGGATPTGSATPTNTTTPTTPVPPGLQSPPPELMEPGQYPLALPLSRRQKAFNKCKTPLYNMEHTDELSIIGHIEPLELPAVVSSGAFYVHRSCLVFSPPYQGEVAAGASSDEDKEQLEEARVKGIVVAALMRKCAFCARHGASIPCKMSCSKYFHLPCVLASGGFMDFQNKASFCKDHLYQVPLVCTADIDCRTCHIIGDIANLMTCVTCGAHYHGTCVGLAQLPGVRSGWQCRACRVCQVCRGECGAAGGGGGGGGGGEPRAVCCEHCDKLYHAHCLRPVMATVPKYGWKCKCCRVCSDCGARSPGAGPSSRWHAHYTVCDSCYQQRNKGSCCPLCRRAYRAAAYRDMIRCTICKRYVHGLCDPEAEPATNRQRKQQSPGYEYHCPICKAHMLMAGTFEEDTMASTSQDSSFTDDNSNSQEQDPLAIEPKSDVGLGKGKPYTVSSKVAKQKMGGYKLKGGYPPPGKIGFKQRQRSALEFGRKRGSKPKMRGMFGVPGLGLQRPQAPDNKTTEDDPGVENKLVLCSSKDKFVLTQDLCVMCGAVGTDSEGCLVACSQCGQTYHPYCVNIKVSAVIVQLGWRCLDCTVCEGCGLRGDEPLLVLCDDCDTTWHTYCATPRLQEVPRSAWRCERCRRCLVCGATNTIGWCDSYTECAPCASLVMCCVCSEPYSDGELIIQCEECRRWLHGACDCIRLEAQAELCCKQGYRCVLCRGGGAPPHLALPPAAPAPAPPSPPRPRPAPTALSLGLAGEFYVDDTCLSQRGANHIKQLETDMGITHQRRKRRFKQDSNADKDQVVANADEPGDDAKADGAGDAKDDNGGVVPNANLKEGVMWNVSVDGPAPEGFTIYTTDSGVTVLRRKRQRNLNKLGIGGFVVRQRQNTKQHDDDKDGDTTLGAGESPSNKRKPRRKPRSKLMEQFPSYMQEAFFGKELLEPVKTNSNSGQGPIANPSESPSSVRPSTPEGYRELRDFKLEDNSDSDGEDVMPALASYTEQDTSFVITLNAEEVDLLNSLKPKEEKEDNPDGVQIKTEVEEGLKHTEDSTELERAILGPKVEEAGDAVAAQVPKVEPTEGGSAMIRKHSLSMLGASLDAMVRDSLSDIEGGDVTDIFKGVLTDDSQESQESSVSSVPYMGPTSTNAVGAGLGSAPFPSPLLSPAARSPLTPYEPAPYHQDFAGAPGSGSNSGVSPLRGECVTGAWTEQNAAPPVSYNQRSADKMRADESLGSAATISAVLYANTNHPEWKTEFPNWVDRCKQILKKWRALPAEQKAPYLQRARDNRSAIRMKKAQQEQERACGQQRSAREAEQERQWKQLQQMRQQQTQQQQQIIHDQRLQAMARLRAPEGEPPPAAPGPPAAALEAPRSTFPAQRFPLHYANSEDINRQLRDLLQRHPDKMWQQQGGGDEGIVPGVQLEGQGQIQGQGQGAGFRQPLPVGLRPRLPPATPPAAALPPAEHHLVMQQRLISSDGMPMQQIQNTSVDQKPNVQTNVASGEPKTEADQGNDEMDMGDMDKLEHDPGNIGEVGDILTGLGGEDDEELLESLTAEIGEQFNILEYADPELATLSDANILDGLELADEAETGRQAKAKLKDETDPKISKPDGALHKSASNIDMKAEVKSESGIIKTEVQEVKEVQMFSDGVQRVITNQQMTLQSAMQAIKCEVKLENEAKEGSWAPSPQPRAVFQHHSFQRLQQPLQQQPVQRAAQFAPQSQGLAQPRPQFSHNIHFQQGGAHTAQTQSILNAMTAQVNAALAAGRSIAPGTRLVGADGAVGVVRHDRTVALAQPPHHVVTAARAPPPPPYPGTLRQSQPPPPPPYPQPQAYGPEWGEWLHRRPMLMQNINQEQPLLLEELLEQEKREQEREVGEWGGGGAAVAVPAAAPVPAIPLYGGQAPPQPPPPPDRPITDADHHARLLYEQWLKRYNAFATDQLRYYESEVQKLRKMRKSLNSKQRQLRKSGNELMPNDAAELQRVSTEQQALQKHLEAARKQARQHSMLMQEYETKQRQNNPQLAQQSVISQQPQQIATNQTVFTQNQNMSQTTQMQQQTINRPMQLGLQSGGIQQQQTLIRTQQVLNSDGQLTQQRIGLVTSPLNQGRIITQGGRTLVIEQGQQQQLVRQLSGVQERPQSVGMVQFGQQQLGGVRSAIPAGAQTPRPTQRPAMSPLHVQSPHSQSPLHSLAPQSPLHHLTSPMQSPLHSQQSPLHHTSQSPLHPSTQSPLHTQQSPLHSQQSPMHVQTNIQQSPMHPQSMHQQQSPMMSQSPMHQSPMHQSQMHAQNQGQIQNQGQLQHNQGQLQHNQGQMQHNQGMQQTQGQIQQNLLQMQQNQSQNQGQIQNQSQMQNQGQMQQNLGQMQQNQGQMQSQGPMQNQGQMQQNQGHMLQNQGQMQQNQSQMQQNQAQMQQNQAQMQQNQGQLQQNQGQMQQNQGQMQTHPPHSPMHPQQSPIHMQQSPMHSQQSPMHSQQSPMHSQQSPMHSQSGLQSGGGGHSQPQPAMSPQQFLQQLTQRTSPQLGAGPAPPSRSPLYPHLQHQQQPGEYSPRFSRSPQTGGGGRFARPPLQPPLRVVASSAYPRQTSPLGSPQPLPSPSSQASDMARERQQLLSRQQYSPLGAPPSPSPRCRSPLVRTPTPHASPAASPAAPTLHDHGGGGHHSHHMAPIPPGYRYFKVGLFGGAPIWPTKDDNRRPSHINKVSILKKRPQPRYPGKTAAPITPEERSADQGESSQKYILYSSDSVDYTSPNEETLMGYKHDDDDDDDIEEYVEHLDDDDIVVVEPGAMSPEERIATEEDFEELIDSRKPEDDVEEEAPVQEKSTRTEPTTKTVAVISLAPAKQPSSNPQNVQQYKLTQNAALSRLQPVLSATVLSSHSNTKILNEVSQATVASVSIANQTISVPVLKSLSVPIANVSGQGLKPLKKVPLNINNQPLSINMSSTPLSKPITSVISVISSNVQKASISPVITLASSNTSAGGSRHPMSLNLTQHQVKQKIVKTIEKPIGLSLSSSKVSSLSVTHDVTLPAKIFQDDAASPDSTAVADNNPDREAHSMVSQPCGSSQGTSHEQRLPPVIKDSKDIDIETEISQQTELPHTLCITDRTPLLLGKTDIKSPDPIPEKIPDNIMEGDDEDKPEDNLRGNLLMQQYKAVTEQASQNLSEAQENVVKTIKAIANQTKDMVMVGSNLQMSSDMGQSSVQISIPSPTPSQERYLNDITMQEHSDTAEGNQKHVECFEDMLSILENIDDTKTYGKHQHQAKPTPNPCAQNIIHQKQESKEALEQSMAQKRETERLGLQSATVPQLSPLSQPAELTSNMANVSQQLRTIMSSLNTNAQKIDPQNIVRKSTDVTAPTQVNFENLLPSSKVEVATSRPSPVHRIEKPMPSLPCSEGIPMSVAQMVGSRVNTLSNLGQIRKSPNVSPINSPVGQGSLMKSPAQSPLISHQSFPSNEETDMSGSSQMMQNIQMPALSKIYNSAQPTMIHTSNTITTSVSGFQKSPQASTSILGHTLSQPSRQVNTSHQFSQSISSSQPPALVMTSRPLMVNKESSPNVTIRTHTIVSPAVSQMQVKPPVSGPVSFITSSKLLHSQLTSPLKRSKSTDEPKSEVIVGHIQPTKRHSVESVIVKSEPMETDDPNVNVSTDSPGNKTPQQNAAQRYDESQNVLLKQLLQTTTATTSSGNVPQRTMTIQRTAPALGTIPSLEAQLARPSIPPPALSLAQEVEMPKNSPRMVTTVNSPFAPRPVQTSVPTSSMSPLMHTSTQSLMDVRKPPIKILKDETIPAPEGSPTMKAMQMYPMNVDNQQLQQAIKKEVAPPQQSPVHRPFTPMDVKKELLDESSQQSTTSGISTASDSKLDTPMKEEYPESVSMDVSSEVNPAETPSEAKKRKRREYQQKKRKQMQMNMKAAAENNISAANAKKKPRKGSRYEEDYDTFIDNLMAQLRLLPPMQIQEPALTTNFAVCPLFGSGDLTKLKNKDYDILKGDLVGEFGNAKIPNVGDYYNTKPFGDEEPLPEKPPASTQRGFYDQEFQPIQFDEDPDEKKLEFICRERDTDTPDSIVSCSSPECLEIEPANRFPGLKLIEDDEDEEDEDSVSGRISPIIPLIAPVPLRMKPVSIYQIKEEDDGLKSLKSGDTDSPMRKMLDSPGSTESNENVTVTLTLTSGAAEDILGVLKELAGILHIPPPTSYQIVERTATPPSHKLGLYRSKGKDGKEGTPIDIQSILNGAAKFCRHCDVVILDSVVRAKASEFPLLSANKGNAEEILCDSDSELYFCSTQCYERFAWRPTNIILDGKSKTAIKEDTKSVDTNLSKDRDDFDTASTESMETDDLDIKPDIKDEKMDLSFMDGLDNDELMKEVCDDVSALDEDLKSEQDEKSNQSVEKKKEKYKGIRYKLWSPGCIGPPVKYKRPTDRELTELVFRTGVAIMPVTNEDYRKCELCGIQGDGVADGVSRLLNCDVDRWVHLNCALWSEGVYETVSGALMNVETALANGSNATCAVCRRLGATVRCFKVRCGSVYHLGCAVKDNCVFYKNKTAFCASHAPKNEKDNELTTLSVQRRVYISRDEMRQVASVMLHSDTNHLIRVGGVIFLSPGHLLPHQLAAFHTPNYIYPIGYKIVRFYWSMSKPNSRCRYLCWISEEEGKPRFHVRAQDESRQEMCAATPRAAWAQVLDGVGALRAAGSSQGVLRLWHNYVTGEDLFGLTEPAVVRVLESLPGIETLTDYRFKFGRSALLEGGLAVNPSGCARCEPRLRAAWRRGPRSAAPCLPAGPASSPEAACPYTKQFVHTKSSQYKKMKMEWRNNVYLARSKIQGLGLYAARDIEKHTMVIEYIGEIIRSELSEIREKQYESKNRGIYMFRLDERRVVDATLSGGLARYINHSCQPNCVAETVEVDRHTRIIIFAKRRISRGEELAYDYKFDIEDDAHKIMCMCGAPNCRKWMN